MKAHLPERRAETELIAKILSGDMRALEALMRTHNRMLYRTARAILRDDAEAEDAVQEAYLQAYRALGTFRGESKLSTWLVRIAANEALMRRRRNTSRAAVVQVDGSAHPEEAHTSDLPGPQNEAERSELRRLLEARIDALPEGYRAVFVLRAVEEMTVEETAAALAIPEATVRTRYFRARGLLRIAMKDDDGQALKSAFAFAGMRCDRIVRRVLPRVRAATRAARMEWPPLLITDEDLARLTRLAAPAELQREIGRATVISRKVASLVGVVTMNSRVLYTDETTGARQLVNLVYPQEAHCGDNCVSVAAPVGTALIGLSTGQAIEWDFPDGTRRRLRVDEVSYGDGAHTAACAQ
jgi:RNA polymerase sigma-70 factor (ECF subfamily)